MSGDIDATLARLRDASEAAAANLLALEADPDAQLLDVAGLTGLTATRWATARAAIDELWRDLRLLQAVVEEATARSAQRRSAEAEARLRDLLLGPSIVVETRTLPLGERNLLEEAQHVTRATPGELLEHMAAGFELATTTVAAAGRAWAELVPKVAAAQAELARASAVAASVAAVKTAEQQAVEAELRAVAQALVSDPLAVSGDAVTRIEQDVASIAAGLDRAWALRDQVDGRLDEARRRVDELADREHAARREVAGVAERVGGLTPPNRIDVDRLAAELGQATALVHAGRWLEAATLLEAVEAGIDADLQHLDEATAAARDALGQRDQLRGLLSALRAKAGQRGLSEDAAAGAAFDAARTVLYTAPTDLEEATMLVLTYQRLVSESDTAPRDA